MQVLKATLSQAAILQQTPTAFSGNAKSHTHSRSLSLWQLACFPFFLFYYKMLMCDPKRVFWFWQLTSADKKVSSPPLLTIVLVIHMSDSNSKTALKSFIKWFAEGEKRKKSQSFASNTPPAPPPPTEMGVRVSWRYDTQDNDTYHNAIPLNRVNCDIKHE